VAVTAGRRAINSMQAQGKHGSLKMSANMGWAFLLVGSIISIYLAGRIAERRGRSFKTWAWIGAIIGPLALPLLFLFPDLHRKNGDHA
jgi:MFS family permease